MIKDADREREDFQQRLAMLFKLMFWSLVGLVVFVASGYARYPQIAPSHAPAVYVVAAIGLGAMAVIWRVLVTRPLLLARLRWLDVIYSIGVGTAFGASAIGQWELRPAGYMSLVWATFTIFARAMVIPSSARRTAVLSVLTFLPMTAAAIALGIATTQEMPGPAFVLGYFLLGIAAIVLATAGSYIIYGLRRQVSQAEHLGQYTLDRKIGEGGMGSVYVAHHALLRRPAAVKILPPERNTPDELARFEREVQSMSKLAHPNTVAVFDYGHSADGGVYYAMEYLAPGIDLHVLVRTEGPQPADRTTAILAQICGALGEAHEQGLVHRDIKPGNVILCERGGMPDIAKLVDFGIAKAIGESVGEILGTPGYVAPEALTGGRVGPAADLYAVGALGYFLLTGRRTFEGTPAEICAQQIRARPDLPSRAPAIVVPSELEAIVMRCLAIDPTARFASAVELAAALRALAHAGDWDDARARAWWHAHKQRIVVSPAAPSPDSITIDLGERVRIA